ncbi:MAG: hypothetical protein IID16_07945 [Candidatus Marinimicrobia bacterium]|nr:hypothetical protein [Candidatus Neomarinimicrobiota bacterium]
MITKHFSQYHNTIALGSFILSLPALTLVASGISYSFFGSSVANSITDKMGIFGNPAIILGGIFLAFILNSLTTIQIRITSEKDVVSTNILVRKFYSNLGILLLAGTLALIILLYDFVENFQMVPR